MRRSANCVAARARVTLSHLRIDCATLSFFSSTDSVAPRRAAPCRSRGALFPSKSEQSCVQYAAGSNHRLMISHKCRSSRRTSHAVDSSRFSRSHLVLSPSFCPRTTFADTIARRFFCSHAQDNYTAKCRVHRWFWVGRAPSSNASVNARKMCLRVVAGLVARRGIAAPNT